MNISDIHETLAAQGLPVVSIYSRTNKDGIKNYAVELDANATLQQIAIANQYVAGLEYSDQVPVNADYLIELVAENPTAVDQVFAIAIRLAKIGNFPKRQAYWNGVKDSLDAVQQSIIVGAAQESGITGIN